MSLGDSTRAFSSVGMSRTVILCNMAVIRISEADASRDFGTLLARVRAGEEVLIEGGSSPAVIVRLLAKPTLRLLSESLALAGEHRSNVTLDGGFERDLSDIVQM